MKRPVLLLTALVLPACADSLKIGGYGRPSNMQETFGVYGDLGASFASHEGRTDDFAFRLAVTNKGHGCGSLSAGIARDIRQYSLVSLWIRSTHKTNAKIGLTDAASSPKPRFAKPLSAYLPGGISNDWQQVLIPMDEFPAVSLRKIVSVVIEVGSRPVGNRFGDVILVDDIRLLDSTNDTAEAAAGVTQGGGSEAVPGPRNFTNNVKWIRGMIHPRTGLVQASIVARESWTYVNASSVLALLEHGEIECARRIGDSLVKRQEPDGSWPGGWDYATGEVIEPDRKVGEVAWACMALLKLHDKARQKKYLRAVENGIAWVNRFAIMDPDSPMFGAYRGGCDSAKQENFGWISSEHQADMLCVLFFAGKVTGKAEYFARARLVADWIVGKAWDWQERRFCVGYTYEGGQWMPSTFDEPTDVQAWLPMVLAATCEGGVVQTNDFRDFGMGINWITNFEKTVEYKGRTVHGLSTKPLSPVNSVNMDHMLYVIKAARLLGKNDLAARYEAEIDKARAPDGVLEVWMIGPPGAVWPLDFRWPHVTPICFDTMRDNPFDLGMGGSCPQPVEVQREVERLASRRGL